MNPACEVQTARFSRHEGKTPAFEPKDVQNVLQSIDTTNILGLTDHGMTGALLDVRKQSLPLHSFSRKKSVPLFPLNVRKQSIPLHSFFV